MMMNLFSVFDPSSYFGVSLNWIVLLMIMMFVPLDYFLVGSKIKSIFNFCLLSVGKVFREVGSSNYMALSFISVVTFMYLMVGNLLGLLPFIFTCTAHPMVTMGWGVVMWLSFFLMGWTNDFSTSAAHLVPEGSPLVLSPLMVLIESVSHLIRPFTLSIRLAANMMAGHLIVGLLSSISLISFSGFVYSLILQNILLVLEVGVAVIQGFVFSILLLLYALEYY